MVDFTVKGGSPEKQRAACVIAGVFESRRLSEAATRLDKAAKGYLSTLFRRGDLTGKLGQTLLLYNVPGTWCDRVLLVGCGRERNLDDLQYRKVIAKAVTALKGTGTQEAVCYLTEVEVKGRDMAWKVRQAVESAEDALYHFGQFKHKKAPRPSALRRLVLVVPDRREFDRAEEAIRTGKAVANGIKLTKDLGNLPGNVCTPSYLAQQAEEMARRRKTLKVEVLDKADMERLGMGALLAVARGSHEPPKFIIAEYGGGQKDDQPLVLVGKGITFDSGGISIKPGQGMDEMKFDMCGAASVFGTLSVVTELRLPLNVIGIIPTTENLPGGSAIKPGDIVTSLSGQTVEILNTDAEGRLILCDALTYAERFDPAAVIDIATLTGACVIALGKCASGLLSNHPPLAQELIQAARTSGDRVWELPLWEDYQDALKSNFADMANVGGREAGAITAACFLARYTKKFHWAHLDIAGTAWLSGDKKGATGRPVALLSQYLLDRVAERDQVAL